jgi:hypothetical protein
MTPVSQIDRNTPPAGIHTIIFRSLATNLSRYHCQVVHSKRQQARAGIKRMHCPETARGVVFGNNRGSEVLCQRPFSPMRPAAPTHNLQPTGTQPTLLLPGGRILWCRPMAGNFVGPRIRPCASWGSIDYNLGSARNRSARCRCVPGAGS